MAQVVSVVGQYENFLYGPPEKNHYHYVSVVEHDSIKGAYIWKTLCNEWTLKPVSSEPLQFMVGEQCPYFEKGYHSMKFKTDHKGNIIGAFGPWNEYFTKVERHSEIKYNLKGVNRPEDFENDEDLENEEKEGNGTMNEMNEINGKHGMYSMKRSVATSLQWKGGQCVRNQCIGRVSIDENFVISFGMTIHGKVCDGWESILHVGHADMERSPGFWLHPKSCKLHARLSDTTSNNTGYDPNTELQVGREYAIKLQAIDGAVSLFVDGKMQTFKANVLHVTRYKAPVFVGDPWYTAANVTISDLRIYAQQ